MTAPKRILGLCGSLRRGSLNLMAMRLAGSVLPAGMTMEELAWRDVPAFDADVLAQGLPDPVKRVRNQIAAADGVLIVTPEYNFSIPGMLKNLIDWVSRGDDQPLAGKPVAIITASAGPVGGARVQYDLRKVMLFVNAMVLVKPEVFIGMAPTKFAADGTCTDETTIKFVRAQMQAFSDWIDAVRRMKGS